MSVSLDRHGTIVTIVQHYSLMFLFGKLHILKLKLFFQDLNIDWLEFYEHHLPTHSHSSVIIFWVADGRSLRKARK